MKSMHEESSLLRPYKIVQHVEHLYSFRTINNITYFVSFKIFTDVTEFNNFGITCFSFDFIPDKESVSRDIRISLTVIEILKNFFANNNDVLFYLCNPDGKQHIRNYMFNKWFATYNTEKYLQKEDAIISVDDTDYFFSIIYRSDNPTKKEIKKIFHSSYMELLNK